MRKLLAILAILTLLTMSAFASDYSDPGWEMYSTSGAFGYAATYTYIPLPLNLTVGTITISGRNNTAGDYSTGLYSTAASGTCNYQAYSTASPYNYTFDYAVSWETSPTEDYKSDYTLTLELSNIQDSAGTGGLFENLSATRKAFIGRGSCANEPTFIVTDITQVTWIDGDDLHPQYNAADMQDRVFIGTAAYIKPGYYTYVPPTPPSPPVADYSCNVDDLFPYESNPFGLSCSDVSIPAATRVNWTLTQPDASEYTDTNSTLIKELTQNGWYGIEFEACNVIGCDYKNNTMLVNLSSTPGVGGIQTYFQAIDGQTGNPIGSAEIQLQDVIIGSWTNVTSGPDGTSSIITNSTTTINAYAQYGDYTTGTRLGVSPCLISGTCLYEIVLFPGFMLPAPGSGLPGDPGIGNVNLVFTVTDYETKQGIYMAQVRVTDEGGNLTSSYTNDAGVKIFAVSNSSSISWSVSKSGYTSRSGMTTTSAFGPDTAYVALFPATGGTVTSTPTPIYTDSEGHIIAPAPTLSTSAQDDALMNQLREAGPGLINLCIIAVALGILKMILKF